MTAVPSQPGPPDSDLRLAAVEVAAALREAGYTAYFAGGCVRDRLMGREPKDYDVATDALPEQVRAIFPRAHSVGEAFGVMLVRQRRCMIEVATFRSDGTYRDGRHPESVTFGDAEHDARRRDFTINGLFEDPVTNEIIDFVGGRRDLERKVIRAIGDPAERVREDRLRMLRAVRFAARFAFAIEPETAETIRESADDLQGVSRERIGHEIRMMLDDDNRAVAIWEIQYLRLDGAVLQEPPRLTAPLRVGRLPAEVPLATALAAWWLDRAREEPIEDAVARWTAALVLSNDERQGLQRVLETHEILAGPWPSLGVAAQKRLASTPAFEPARILIRTEDAQAFVDIQRRVMELAETDLAPEPLIGGEDLIRAGLQPGPTFKRILDGVYDAQLEGSIANRDEALALAEAIVQTEPEGG
ncbi:MAG: CCA tRNA nucleotidyltransferase [Planctomycetes bacterium]|nr:CCA tRNA nucleotidyltransferase [Planctomycetota bacterium]